MERIPLPVIAGPTASGKTALAVALARKLNGEVISADSMQVYAGISVGTARPTEAEMEGIPHHLLGFQPLDQPYSVARYVEDARRAIRETAARGRLPILCGGTGLYISSLVENRQYASDGGDLALRAALQKRAEEEGGGALLRELAAADPETAARLHPRDVGRIVRALEIYRITGMTMSEHNRRSRREPSPFDAVVIVLDCRDRQRLYDRIDRRAEVMLDNGLLEEARRVLATGEAATAVQAIGYKEFAPYLAGEISLEEALEGLKRTTRRYAKRQLTWFRHMDAAWRLYIDDYEDPSALAAAAEEAVRRFIRL